MPAFKKHVGRNKNGTRLAVVFREIPGAEDYCLCVETDSLSEMYHDQLLREIDSRDAQQTVDLFKILERRHFGDGQQMLNALHNKGLLRKYPVSEIEMQPMPNRIVALDLVNKEIAGTAKESDYTAEVAEEVKTVDAADNPVVVDTEAGLIKPPLQTETLGEAPPIGTPEADPAKVAAEGKLLQARLMEEDAKKMREEAYSLDPALKKGGRPKKVK